MSKKSKKDTAATEFNTASLVDDSTPDIVKAALDRVGTPRLATLDWLANLRCDPKTRKSYKTLMGWCDVHATNFLFEERFIVKHMNAQQLRNNHHRNLLQMNPAMLDEFIAVLAAGHARLVKRHGSEEAVASLFNLSDIFNVVGAELVKIATFTTKRGYRSAIVERLRARAGYEAFAPVVGTPVSNYYRGMPPKDLLSELDRYIADEASDAGQPIITKIKAAITAAARLSNGRIPRKEALDLFKNELR